MDKYIAECKQLGIPYIYDPSQQIVRVDGETLLNGIDGAKALFVNEYEFELVRKMTGLSEEEVFEKVEFLVVTLGAKGVKIYTSEGMVETDPVPPKQIGAGDAFRGGFLTGYRMGWDFRTCAQMGALSATYCLESDGPQGQGYSIEEYISRYREHFDDGGKLDLLLAQ